MTADRLRQWLMEPDSRSGIRFHDRHTGWSVWPYSLLAEAAFGVAEALRDRRVRPGDVVMVMQGTTSHAVAGVFGCLAAGATPAPAAGAALFRPTAEFVLQAGNAIAATGPVLILTRPDWGALLREAMAAGAVPPTPVLTTEELPEGRGGGSHRLCPLPGPALLQLTSGSTGSPRAVAVPRSALQDNLEAIRHWLGMTSDDATASWLPLHHDMGLIGSFLLPVTIGAELWLMQPESFVRDPLTWLRCMGSGSARLSATPAFGLTHVLRKVKPADLRGLDFTGWKAVIVGAERIDATVLDRFADLLQPYGFDRCALAPAYGLAEATLAVTGSALDAVPAVRHVYPRTLAPGRRVAVVAATAFSGTTGIRVVGCGSSLVPGAEVRIVDDEGHRLPDEHVGEIVVNGPCAVAGEPAAGGGRRTGDTGFWYKRELFVIGRRGDALSRRGRIVFAEDLELLLAAVPGVPARKAVVLLGNEAGRDLVVGVVEAPPGPWADEAATLLRSRVDDAGVVVLSGSAGVISRTTSGKPRRRRLWEAFVSGGLKARVLVDDRVNLPGLRTERRQAYRSSRRGISPDDLQDQISDNQLQG